MVEIRSADTALYRRWLDVVMMRSRQSNARLAPLWARLQHTGDAGIDWLAAMERWERGGYHGEDRPEEFERYIAFFQHAQPPDGRVVAFPRPDPPQAAD